MFFKSGLFSGAVLCFGCSVIYCSTQTWISFRMIPLVNSLRVARFRLFLCCLMFCTFMTVRSNTKWSKFLLIKNLTIVELNLRSLGLSFVGRRKRSIELAQTRWWVHSAHHFVDGRMDNGDVFRLFHTHIRTRDAQDRRNQSQSVFDGRGFEHKHRRF